MRQARGGEAQRDAAHNEGMITKGRCTQGLDELGCLEVLGCPEGCRSHPMSGQGREQSPALSPMLAEGECSWPHVMSDAVGVDGSLRLGHPSQDYRLHRLANHAQHVHDTEWRWLAGPIEGYPRASPWVRGPSVLCFEQTLQMLMCSEASPCLCRLSPQMKSRLELCHTSPARHPWLL